MQSSIIMNMPSEILNIFNTDRVYTTQSDCRLRYDGIPYGLLNARIDCTHCQWVIRLGLTFSYVTTGVPAMLVSVAFFIIPSKIPSRHLAQCKWCGSTLGIIIYKNAFMALGCLYRGPSKFVRRTSSASLCNYYF